MRSLCFQGVNMTKNYRVNLVSYYGGWGTAVESSMIFHGHCNVTGMNIYTYADQTTLDTQTK